MNIPETVRHLSWESICMRFRLENVARSTEVLVLLCPFHKEKTPSMHLYPKEGTFHCYGCHKGGDKMRFIVEMLEKPESELTDHDMFFFPEVLPRHSTQLTFTDYLRRLGLLSETGHFHLSTRPLRI